MAISIRDVAKRAGVANGTVSRAFNGYDDIRPETKQRIFEAARELNYSPNVSARSLSSKVPPNIGLIVSGLLEANSKDNLIYLVLQGVYRYTLEHHLEVALYTTDSQNQAARPYSRFCSERSIAGAIVSGITTNDPYFRELVDSSFPCVVIDIQLPGRRCGCVSVDNCQASAELTRLLLEQGHRNIVLISGKKDTAVTTERIAGVAAALAEYQMELAREHVIYCDFNEELAYQKTREYLEEHGTRDATAFLCLSDVMAYGVMRAIRESGYSIPTDFSVVGFDGLPLSEYTAPPLTTVWQDMSRIGYEAARLLHQLIQGKDVEKRVYVPYQLLIRSSTRAL